MTNPRNPHKIDFSRQKKPMETVGRTGDEIVAKSLSTIPESLRNVIRNKLPARVVSTIFRMHPDDHSVAKILLKKDRLSFQKFFEYCLRGYMDADPYMLRFLKTSRELDEVPQAVQAKHVLSHRLRTEIYDELEQAEKAEKAEKAE